MAKEKFITSTIILIIGGFITKFLGMFIKIIMTRLVGIEGIGLYMLIFPTFSLFMTISQLGFPIAISKLIAEETHNNKKILFSVIPFSLLLNLLLMLVITVIAPTLSLHLLKDPRSYYPILAIALVLPFDSMSAILRGYFFGKQRMFPHVVSNITEQIVRLLLIILIIPELLEKNLVYAVVGLVAVNIISELFSSLVLFFFIPKKLTLDKTDLKPNKSELKSVLKIALPTTGSRIIGSIGYFFEPILLTTSLMLAGYDNSFMIHEYGVVEGFVMPLLMLPSFFTSAISSALIPVISKAHVNNHKTYIKRKIKQAILISLGIGIPITIILMINPTFFLNIIYHVKEGENYLRFIAPFCLIYYIQIPLASILQSMNKASNLMIDNLIGLMIRSILMFCLSLLKIGIYGFLIAMISNIIIVTLLHIHHIKKELKT